MSTGGPTLVGAVHAAKKELIAAHGLHQRASQSGSATLFKFAAEAYEQLLEVYYRYLPMYRGNVSD